nr:MAG TPA: hypothetical protein [Caudoviricetes sp.]
MSIKTDVLKYIEDKLATVSPNTVDIYKERFSNMTDKQVQDYINKYGIRIIQVDEIPQKEIDKLKDKLKLTIEERLVVPFQKITSEQTCMIFPIQIRRLQQLSSKESHSTMDANTRNKVNQSTRESRTGQLSDAEVAQMVAIGLDHTLNELLSPRSDNLQSKREMNEMIKKDLTFEMGKISKNEEGKSTIKYINSLYLGMNLATDLVDNIDEIS